MNLKELSHAVNTFADVTKRSVEPIDKDGQRVLLSIISEKIFFLDSDSMMSDATSKEAIESFQKNFETRSGLPFHNFGVILSKPFKMKPPGQTAIVLLGFYVKEISSEKAQILSIWAKLDPWTPSFDMQEINFSDIRDGSWKDLSLNTYMLITFLNSIHGKKVTYGEAKVGVSKQFKLVDRNIYKTFSKVVVLRDKQSYEKSGDVYEGVHWHNSVWIPGHWRREFLPGTKEVNWKFIGKDRHGERTVKGHTWVVEHIKGDGPLIERIWAVEKSNPAKNMEMSEVISASKKIKKMIEDKAEIFGIVDTIVAFCFWSIVYFAGKHRKEFTQEQMEEIPWGDIDPQLEVAIRSLKQIAKAGEFREAYKPIGPLAEKIRKLYQRSSTHTALRINSILEEGEVKFSMQLPFAMIRTIKRFQPKAVSMKNGEAFMAHKIRLRTIEHMNQYMKNPEKEFRELLVNEFSPDDDDDDDGDEGPWFEGPDAS